MTTLRNKTALVTGASNGIGRATALALARVGAHVLVHYGRSAQEAESLVAAIQAEGGRAEAIPADLGTPDGASLLAEQVGSIVADRLDVLVLNAGISKAARIADYTSPNMQSEGKRLQTFAFVAHVPPTFLVLHSRNWPGMARSGTSVLSSRAH
jgi:NAD(P)-dependent dehydrogenase (short-subunit alcohol dehydrogenase family)